MKLILEHLSITILVVSFLSCTAFQLFKGRTLNLSKLISVALEVSTIPMGMALIYCAFYPEKVNQLEGLNLIFALSGLVIIYVGIESVKNFLKSYSDYDDRFKP